MTPAPDRGWRVIDDVVGPDLFLVRWRVDGLRASFRAYKVAATCDGVRLYTRAGAVDSTDHVEDPEQAELYASGVVKWDGCGEVTFGEALHLCGRGSWQAHIELVAYLWCRVGELVHTHGDDFGPLVLGLRG